MVISADFTHSAGAELCLATTQQPQDSRTVSSQSTVFQMNVDGKLVPTFAASYTYRSFGSSTNAKDEGAFSQTKVYSIAHQPDADFVATETGCDLVSQSEERGVYGALREYLKLLVFKQPQAKLLEISSSTESNATSWLSSLENQDDGPWLEHYDSKCPLSAKFPSRPSGQHYNQPLSFVPS
jgi:hypothetical protein